MMIYKPDAVLAELAAYTTLEDGDIVMTGTPAGVGPVREGEYFHGSVLAGDEAIVSANWVAKNSRL